MIRAALRLGILAAVILGSAASAQDKPNILIIWGDDKRRKA